MFQRKFVEENETRVMSSKRFLGPVVLEIIKQK